MNQGNLFENREPLARSSDEATSHAAAAKLTESGKRSSQKAQILNWMFEHLVTSEILAMTSAEIARGSGLKHPCVHKRLPDLLRDGHIRKGPSVICNVTGSECVTWYAVASRE